MTDEQQQPKQQQEQQRRTSDTHNEKYHHRHALRHYRAATVFMRREDNGGVGYHGEGWYASIALCSYDDNFCKSRGRSLAHHRYFELGAPNVFLGKEPDAWKRVLDMNEAELVKTFGVR